MSSSFALSQSSLVWVSSVEKAVYLAQWAQKTIYHALSALEHAEHGQEQADSSELEAELQIGTQTFSVRLYDCEAARQWLDCLPMTLDMQELNGNEKYAYLSQNFPTQEQAVGQIQTGDLMLYGSDCIVLFYDSFSTNYRYTRLGYVQDVDGLAQAIGNGAVSAVFTRVE